MSELNMGVVRTYLYVRVRRGSGEDVPFRPGAIPNPESESKDESESGFDSGFGIMCSGIGFRVGIV